VLGALLKASPRLALGTRTSVALLPLGVLAGGASPAAATSPSLTWSSPRRIDTHGLLDIRCPTPTASNRWDLTTGFTDNSFTGVACPGTSLCVARRPPGR